MKRQRKELHDDMLDDQAFMDFLRPLPDTIPQRFLDAAKEKFANVKAIEPFGRLLYLVELYRDFKAAQN